jgi:hypothetical protein
MLRHVCAARWGQVHGARVMQGRGGPASTATAARGVVSNFEPFTATTVRFLMKQRASLLMGQWRPVRSDRAQMIISNKCSVELGS